MVSGYRKCATQLVAYQVILVVALQVWCEALWYNNLHRMLTERIYKAGDISFLSRGHNINLGHTLDLLAGNQETEEDKALLST